MDFVIKISMRTSPVAGVLKEPFSQLNPLSGVAVQARQSTQAGSGTVYILCSLAGRYGYSAELAYLSKVRLKLPLLVIGQICTKHSLYVLYLNEMSLIILLTNFF
jgi:hypothetical protein